MIPIEIIALTVIIFSVIKMLVLAINPITWMNFSRTLIKRPNWSRLFILVLAGIVFYFLIDGGISLVQILAVTAFVSLMVIFGIIPYADTLVMKYREQVKRGNVFRDNWLYVLIWIIILIFAVGELIGYY